MDDEKAKPVLQEIATTGDGRDLTRGFVSPLLLEPHEFDTVLKGRGGDLKIYDEVRRDDQVKSTFQQRRLALTSRELLVEPGGTGASDKAAAEFVEELVKEMRFDDITDKMLWGLFWGWAVGECLWERDGRFVTIGDVKIRNTRRFRWDRDGNLRLITQSNREGEIMPPRKFWTYATGSDNDDEPYGLGLAHWLYWPVFFKRNDLKFWLIFCDKFGMPTPHGKYHPSATPQDIEKLLAALAAIQTDSGVVTPEGMTIDLIEAARGGSSSYADLYDRMDAAIAKVVLSQTMTTDNGSSRSQGEVHMDVRQEVVKADSDLLMGSFNRGPIKWLTDWNFPGANAPRVWRRVEDDPDLKPVAERDKLIFDMGYQPTPQYIVSTYGDGWVPREITPPKVDGTSDGDGEDGEENDSAAFAERRPASPGDRVDDLAQEADDATQAAADPLIDRIRELVDGATTMEEVAEGLLAASAGMDIEDFADNMREALAVAELMGRSDLVDGR